MFITLTLMHGERPFGAGPARWQEDGAVEINPAFIEALVRDDEAGVTTIEMNSGQAHNVKETVAEIKLEIDRGLIGREV